MSLYDKLGVNKDASKSDITKAYRKLSLEHHPDRPGGNEEIFKDISHAYEILTDDEKRKRYDLTGSETEQPQHHHHQNFNPFEFMFNQHFQQQQHFQQHREEPIRKLEDTVHSVDISLKDAYFGIQKNLLVTSNKKCDCTKHCDVCNGNGRLRVVRNMGPFQQVLDADCNNCRGKGFIIKGCGKCGGLGRYKDKETFNLVIPKGATTGLERRMSGKGEQPFKKSEIAGDLVFKINVKEHPLFVRKGNDLHYSQDISFVDSVCGVDIVIPHFEEEVYINTSTFGIVKHSGEYRVEGKGMNEGSHLIIKFNVKYPIYKLSGEVRYKIRDLLTIEDNE
jgi:DnaJ-class molecular chaperone